MVSFKVYIGYMGGGGGGGGGYSIFCKIFYKVLYGVFHFV